MKKRVLITGGNSSLGRSIIDIFIKNNYDVIFTYCNNYETALKIHDFYHKKGIEVQCEKLDLTCEESIKKLIENLETIDVVINNAAYNDDCHYNEKSYDSFNKIINTNLIGPFLLIKNIIPLLKKNGNIVNVASTNGIDTMYSESMDYDASKAGLINLTKNLASTLSPVRVNAVAPGWINTESTLDMEDRFKKREINKIALKRFADADEVAKVIYFIASDDASYVNGSIIRVDGGKNYEV